MLQYFDELQALVSSIGEANLVSYSSYLMLASGALTLVSLFFVSAPYGRYNGSMPSWSILPLLPARLAWVIMETPNLWVYVLVFLNDGVLCNSMPNTILLCLFIGHYINRSLIFPFRMKAGAPMPVQVMMLAMMFCTWNGLTQVVYLSRVHCYR